MTFNVPETLPVGTKTFTASIYLGELTNIGDDKVVGYTATLTYDKNMVESVTMEQQNGWTATLTNGAIVASIDNVEANKETAKLTFTLKDGIEAGKELNIKLQNVQITNDVNLNQTFNFSKTTTFTAVNQSEGTDADKGSQTGNEQNKQEENKQDVKDDAQKPANTAQTNDAKKTTNTVTTNATKNQTTIKKLPKAGIQNIIIVAITIIAIVGIACIIRAKTIKLK